MATMTTSATTFDTLDEWLGRKVDRPYAHNTRAQRRGDDAIAIRLHQTDVVTFYRDGRVRVTNGGWDTPTTWDRIRGALPNVRIADGRYLYRFEGGSYIHPTNDAERAQALDGRNEYGYLDVTFQPDELPTIKATGRSLTMRACGEGRHQGEARIGDYWSTGTTYHYAATRVKGKWTVTRTTDPDASMVDYVGEVRTLRDAKRLAWADAHALGHDT